MARIGKKGILSGLVGNLVFRNLDGKQIVQSRPDGVRQTANTKASSGEFRQCSTWAKQLRMGLRSFLSEETDSYMYRRFTGAFYQALLQNKNFLKGTRTPFNCDLSALHGFEFNIHSPFKNHFLPPIAVQLNSDGNLRVSIPEFEPKNEMYFNRKHFNAELMLYVYTTTFTYNQPVIDATFSLSIANNYSSVAATDWMSPVLPSGRFVLVVAKLFYYSNNPFTGKKYCNSKEMSPAMVVFSGVVA